MAEIRDQQHEADQMVYELRRGPGPRPLDPEANERYFAEVEEAKARRNEIQMALGARLRELAQINEPERVARSQVGLSLRVLRQFINNRFPQPVKSSPFRRMSGPASPDLSRDPLEAFADDWVDKMGRTQRKLATARRDRRPNRDWDKERRKHREMMRRRSLEKVH